MIVVMAITRKLRSQPAIEEAESSMAMGEGPAQLQFLGKSRGRETSEIEHQEEVYK
jgi:hypothetical protein